ncbi:N-acetyltransferase [Thraustotheca clavata]|uniref:N-alpha-acetyltransferase 40 n=1 Tax=Thraustotheca clavata TaxID=74557 RepID=A0A1V9ZWD6_9STRA|nr:N-acetyltransferase [Thraustotheca clavata]
MPPKTKRLTKKEQQARARKQVLDKVNGVTDFLVEFAPFSTYDTNDGVYQVRSLRAANLTENEKTQIVELFCANMQSFYEQSSWGFDLEAKRTELFEEKARYFIVNSVPGMVDAFMHFRFFEDDGAEVAYVYELQVGPNLQRKGVGKRLMQMLELISTKYKLKWIVLTVFKANESAMQFYTKKMGFEIDDTSPSQHDNTEESYEILSKQLM